MDFSWNPGAALIVWDLCTDCVMQRAGGEVLFYGCGGCWDVGEYQVDCTRSFV